MSVDALSLLLGPEVLVPVFVAILVYTYSRYTNSHAIGTTPPGQTARFGEGLVTFVSVLFVLLPSVVILLGTPGLSLCHSGVSSCGILVWYPTALAIPLILTQWMSPITSSALWIGGALILAALSVLFKQRAATSACRAWLTIPVIALGLLCFAEVCVFLIAPNLQ